MADTRAERLDEIDSEIALGRKQYLAAYFCGDDTDAHDYAHHVDELLDERNRIVRGPFAVDANSLPTINTRKEPGS